MLVVGLGAGARIPAPHGRPTGRHALRAGALGTRHRAAQGRDSYGDPVSSVPSELHEPRFGFVGHRQFGVNFWTHSDETPSTRQWATPARFRAPSRALRTPPGERFPRPPLRSPGGARQCVLGPGTRRSLPRMRWRSCWCVLAWGGGRERCEGGRGACGVWNARERGSQSLC